MNFFFDRNVSIRLARMLQAYDTSNTIVHQDDDVRFAPDSPDAYIIHELSRDDPPPVLITADEAMKRRPDERQALATSGLTVVFLRAGFSKLPRHTQAVKLLNVWPEIVKATSRCRAPTAFEVPPSAQKVDKYCETKDLGTG